jgi:hypothetical protein
MPGHCLRVADDRASRVDQRQSPLSDPIEDLRLGSMSGDRHPCAIGDLIRRTHDPHSEALEPGGHLLIVDDRSERVDGARARSGCFDHLDSAADAVAEPEDVGANDTHVSSSRNRRGIRGRRGRPRRPIGLPGWWDRSARRGRRPSPAPGLRRDRCRPRGPRRDR